MGRQIKNKPAPLSNKQKARLKYLEFKNWAQGIDNDEADELHGLHLLLKAHSKYKKSLS